VDGEASLQANYGSYAGVFRFENLGTLLKSSGLGTNMIAGLQFSSAGRMEVLSGTIRFNGSVAFLPSAATLVLLGGSTPGSNHGQLLVDGTATLAGTIEARLWNGYVPEIGQTFQILSTRSRTGTFANTGFSPLSDNLRFLSLYNSSGLAIQVQIAATAWPLGMRQGQLHLLVSGNLNTTYIIQSTGDLRTWTDLLVTNLSVASLEFVDPDTNRYPHRFYRVKPFVYPAPQSPPIAD
jgi:hypothetical protein